MFKDARNDAEERIYSQINEKIDDFFDLGKITIAVPAFVCHLRKSINPSNNN